MSEFTTREILDMIEANGGPEGLPLSGRDLSEIDLSRDTIQSEVERIQDKQPEARPAWWSDAVSGIQLMESCLQEADLRQARLDWANLSGADLSRSRDGVRSGTEQDAQESVETKLRFPDPEQANLSRADLEEVNLDAASRGGSRHAVQTWYEPAAAKASNPTIDSTALFAICDE